eukprot:TRINITY_DN18862_c0_g1_i1.p1 TRINITY_DN18862_c0_g1~~TRINITY_DN18862_c0_g1_i1.p1  ORF type:complete len:486 (-),score=92.44 TRINITY_DN18862_c0_g1_i1:181-1638(-)
MSAAEHMEKLVGLFLQSALSEEGVSKLGNEPLPPEAIERGIETTEKMLCSEDAISMGGRPAPTFVCLAMAMEDKPQLQWASVRCYEQALKYVNRQHVGASWERAVILEQLAAVCHRNGRSEDAVKWLLQCTEECDKAPGHPRDAVLFDNNFNTSQTRLEFRATVEKFLAQAYHKIGDLPQAHEHMAKAQQLQKEITSDAVERQSQLMGSNKAVADTAPGHQPSSSPAVVGVGDIKELWAGAAEEHRLKRYRYTDEGATVLVILDLNEHLGLGEEASSLVESLRQFRVLCEQDSVDVRLRVRMPSVRGNGLRRIHEYHLRLEPLVQDIIPEDTVPRLRGREGKRRLEIKLFKRDKDRRWPTDLVRSDAKVRKAEKTSVATAPKGTALNPLSPEEIARLPKPSEKDAPINRPSSWNASEPTTLPSAVSSAISSPSQSRTAPVQPAVTTARSTESVAHSEVGLATVVPARVAAEPLIVDADGCLEEMD